MNEIIDQIAGKINDIPSPIMEVLSTDDASYNPSLADKWDLSFSSAEVQNPQLIRKPISYACYAQDLYKPRNNPYETILSVHNLKEHQTACDFYVNYILKTCVADSPTLEKMPTKRSFFAAHCANVDPSFWKFLADKRTIRQDPYLYFWIDPRRYTAEQVFGILFFIRYVQENLGFVEYFYALHKAYPTVPLDTLFVAMHAFNSTRLVKPKFNSFAEEDAWYRAQVRLFGGHWLALPHDIWQLADSKSYLLEWKFKDAFDRLYSFKPIMWKGSGKVLNLTNILFMCINLPRQNLTDKKYESLQTQYSIESFIKEKCTKSKQ